MITYEPAAPVSPSVSQGYGALEQEMRDRQLQLQMAALAHRGGQGGGGGGGAQQPAGPGIFGGREGGPDPNQAAQLSQQNYGQQLALQQNALTQPEQLRLQRMQQALSYINDQVESGDMTDEDARDRRTQLATGIGVYQERQARAAAMAREQQNRLLDQQIQTQEAHRVTQARLASQSLEQRTQQFNDPGVEAQVRREYRAAFEAAGGDPDQLEAMARSGDPQAIWVARQQGWNEDEINERVGELGGRHSMVTGLDGRQTVIPGGGGRAQHMGGATVATDRGRGAGEREPAQTEQQLNQALAHEEGLIRAEARTAGRDPGTDEEVAGAAANRLRARRQRLDEFRPQRQERPAWRPRALGGREVREERAFDPQTMEGASPAQRDEMQRIARGAVAVQANQNLAPERRRELTSDLEEARNLLARHGTPNRLREQDPQGFARYERALRDMQTLAPERPPAWNIPENVPGAPPGEGAPAGAMGRLSPQARAALGEVNRVEQMLRSANPTDDASRERLRGMLNSIPRIREHLTLRGGTTALTRQQREEYQEAVRFLNSQAAGFRSQ